jgi:hypothetical protein
LFGGDVEMVGSELTVLLDVRITATGETDCPPPLGGGDSFDIRLSALMTIDQLQTGGPWQFETESGAPLQIRVTLATSARSPGATGAWELGEVKVFG